MNYLTDKTYKQVLKMMAWIVFAIVACRLTSGWFTLFITGLGVWCALARKPGWAICHYILLPFLLSVNYFLLPKSDFIWNIGLRVGPLVIALALSIGSVRRSGSHRLPFAGILPFLAIACISSINGYAPQISYMKLINYFLFLIGLWLGTQNLQYSPNEIGVVRNMFLAMIFIVVYVSIALIPFPVISFATGLRGHYGTESLESINAIGREMLAAGDQTLFCGMMCHSQWLSPFSAISIAFLICDMLFVEKRIRVPHLITIVLLLPILYMTRSRVAIITFIAGMFVINFYTIVKLRLVPNVKKYVRNLMLMFSVAIVIGGVAMEVKDNTISRWLRKTNDVSADKRGIAEAVTDSRRGLIEACMYDFRRNPMFGSGFQVDVFSGDILKRTSGFVFSAPIEKGVLPVMVLGETGIVGFMFFLFFLISFYYTCVRRHLFVTITMFTLLFVSNLGEATFFSPGGLGGVLWIMTVVGGFVLDTIILIDNQRLFVR